jgi:hypothetical protein
MVRKLKTFMLSFACSILLVEAEGFAQVQQPSSKISSLVQELVQEISSDARTGYTSQQLGERHSSKFIFVDNQARIYVRVVATIGKASTLGEKIVQMGGVVLSASDEEIYCLVPYDAMADLAGQNHLLFIGIGPVPQVRTGSVTSAGDAQLFADKARDLFYANGSTVMIGVISDGMQYRQNSINSGDLPGNIISIDNSHECQGTEGTAMMEIVYDLAPGSQLAFGGVGTRNGVPGTPLRMTNLITHMAQAGCKVIVDDIGWPVGYSQFEDREITGSIEQFVQSSAGSYVSACGNDAKIMWAGQSAPSGSHQRKWMLFGADSMLTVTISRSDTLFVELQWADPWTNAQQNLDLHLADASGNILVSSVNGIGQGIPPEENIKRFVTAGTYRVFVEWSDWYQGLPQKHFRLLALGADSVRPQTSGYHVYGHAAAQNAISVAAYNASTPNAVEPFSSRGPSLLVTSGGSTFERQTPKITATDGVQTKVGQNGYFGNPFYGTSAAAPHVAAIAALYYSRFPSHTTGNFFSAMTSSASTIQVGQGGQYNPTSGFGKIRAYDALVKGLTTLASPQVTTNTNWILVRVIGTANIAAERIVTIPASTTTLIEGTVLFGNANARIQVEGTLILTQGASVNPENVVTMGTGRVIGGNFVTVEVTQVDINNAPFDSVGRWRWTYFEKRAAPYRFGSQNNARETFRALQDFKPGTPQKYHDWDTYTNVANHQTFTIDTSHTLYKARFHPTDSTITIKTDLLEAPGTTGGNIQFRDPWYIDSADAQYGGNWRNRGMQQARYLTRSLTNQFANGWKPDFTTTYPESPNHPYRGVFLNQDYNDPGVPYYSVGAPNPNTIGGFESYFVNWTGHPDSVGYQNANAQQTGVVFKTANATAVAKYKAHLRSNSPAALSTNGQRKLSRWRSVNNQAYYTMLYESAGLVWETQSADSMGTAWLPERLISTTAGVNRSPSLAVRPAGANSPYGQNVFVWHATEGGVNRIWRVEPYGSNNLPTLVATITPHPSILTAPAMALYSSTSSPAVDFVAWTGPDGIEIMKSTDYGTTWARDFYSDSVTSRYRPSMIQYPGRSVFLAYDNSRGVYFDFYEWLGGIGWGAATWYRMLRNGEMRVPGSVSHRSGFIGNAQIAPMYNGQGVAVVWEMREGQYVTDEPAEEEIEAEVHDGTGIPADLTEYSVCFQGKDYRFADRPWGPLTKFVGYNFQSPTITELSNDRLQWLWSDGQRVYRSESSNRGVSWSTPSALHEGVSPHVAIGTGVPVPETKYVFRSLSGPIYRVGHPITQPPVQDDKDATREVVVSDELSEGTLSVEASSLWVKTSSSTTETIPFAVGEDSAFAATLDNVEDYLGTTAFVIPSDADSIYFRLRMSSKNASALAARNTPLRVKVFCTVDGSGTRTVARWRFANDHTLNKTFRLAARSLRGRQVQFQVAVLGLHRTNPRLQASVGKVQRFRSPGSPSPKLAEQREGEPPVTYALHQNYPNPFNPATEIRFDLPEPGHVSLTVFDVLGKQVAELVNEYREAGYDRVTWNASDHASGVYFIRLRVTKPSGEVAFTKSGKLVLTK